MPFDIETTPAKEKQKLQVAQKDLEAVDKARDQLQDTLSNMKLEHLAVVNKANEDDYNQAIIESV